ncbi:unnamed protein product [Nezara viridula]|uniref:MHD domain-containing protein n=1 Tax=Nezara viridula TaxID=85310 RepID=A0A9P0HI96_NEZVI|nr:unnamed protein product [Nezara viridula]
MPELRLGLNDKVLFESTGRGKSKSVELEDVKFHQCVRLSRFENDRTISFIPPDGEFELMSYRLNTHVKPLIWIESVIERYAHSRVEYMIKAKSQFKRRSTANNVEVVIPVPADADSPKFKTTVGSVKYAPEQNAITWTIKSFPGGKEYLMRAHFGLPSVMCEDTEGKPPIQVKFEIPYFTTSGIQELKLVQTVATHSHHASLRSIGVYNGPIHDILATGGADDTVHLYDLRCRKECGILSNHSGVIHLSIHPSGKMAFSIGADKTLRTWNLVKGRPAYTINLSGKVNRPEIVEWSLCGEYYGLVNDDALDIYAVATAKVIHTLKVSSRICVIHVYDLNSKKPRKKTSYETSCRITCITVSKLMSEEDRPKKKQKIIDYSNLIKNENVERKIRFQDEVPPADSASDVICFPKSQKWIVESINP